MGPGELGSHKRQIEVDSQFLLSGLGVGERPWATLINRYQSASTGGHCVCVHACVHMYWTAESRQSGRAAGGGG